MNQGQGHMPMQGQGQGQGQGQPQQQAGQQGQPQQQKMQLIQPQHIRNLSILSEDEKTKYVSGLEGLWNKVKSTPQGSAENKAATDKIHAFSQMLRSKIAQRQHLTQHRQAMHQQQQLQQAQQNQAQNGQQQPNPAQAQNQQQQQRVQQVPGQPQQQAPQQQQTPVPRPPSAAQRAPTQVSPPPPQPQQQPQGGVASRQMPAQPGQGQGAPQPQQQAQQQPMRPQSEQMNQHVDTFKFRLPADLQGKPAEEVARWTEPKREQYRHKLALLEMHNGRIKRVELQLAQRQQAGNLTEEEQKNLGQMRQKFMAARQEAQNWITTFRKQFADGQVAQGKAPAAQQQDNGQPGVQQPPQLAAAAAGNRPMPVNGGIPQPQNRGTPNPAQQAQAQLQAQRAEQANGAAAAARGQQVQAGRGQVPGAGPPPNPTRGLSHSHANTLANEHAAAQGQQQMQQQQTQKAGTPGSATPQNSAGPQQQQQQQQQSQPQTQAQQQQQITQPQPQQSQQPPQQGHAHAHAPQVPATIHTRMPIPKQLPEKATAVPQGVTVGGGVKGNRPTMNQGSGIMGPAMHQPVVQKIPAYNNEAEGDRVLSKKKLDELVRQVCGGVSDGQESNVLTPEVEESVLTMADSFVDNVLHAACRNAKERGSKVLEIRDIQLVLERTYNIRVPGYSSDELRTVRKVQPAPGWINKMSAVQAAKVMPGKGE